MHAYLLWAAGAVLSASEPTNIHTDSLLADKVEASYAMECAATKSLLKFEERKNFGEDVPLSQKRRVSFREFSVAGRSLSEKDLLTVRNSLARLSWVERVEGRCSAAGDVFVDVTGMDAEAWARFVSKMSKERPRRTIISIHANPKGVIDVR